MIRKTMFAVAIGAAALIPTEASAGGGFSSIVVVGSRAGMSAAQSAVRDARDQVQRWQLAPHRSYYR